MSRCYFRCPAPSRCPVPGRTDPKAWRDLPRSRRPLVNPPHGGPCLQRPKEWTRRIVGASGSSGDRCYVKTFEKADQVVGAFADALNVKDASALGELFSEDAEFVNILGMRMQGLEVIAPGHPRAVAGTLQGWVIEYEAVDDVQVDDDVTVVYGHCVRRRLPDAPVEGLQDG